MKGKIHVKDADEDEDEDDENYDESYEASYGANMEKTIASLVNKSSLQKKEVVAKSEAPPDNPIQTEPQDISYGEDDDDEDIFGSNIYEEEDDGKEPDNKLSSFGKSMDKNKTKLIVSVIVVGLAVSAVFIMGLVKKDVKNVDKAAPAPPVEEEVIATETVWGTSANLNYAEYIEEPEKLYTDSMIITKFVLEDESSALYYFSGIPKNFKRKIVFPVTLAEYNSVPSGGKIFIDYRIISSDGVDRVTSISTSVEEQSYE